MLDASEYICECGNDASNDGFDPCNDEGVITNRDTYEVPPNWKHTFACVRCGAMTVMFANHVFIEILE